MRVVLASRSPARKSLLEALGYDVVTKAVPVREFRAEKPSQVIETCIKNAVKKALAAGNNNIPVVAADTLVFDDKVVFGKPKNEKDAFAMLSYLGGKWHSVVSALAVVFPGGHLESGYDVARVKFRPLSEDDISYYVRSGEPLGKAGGYGLQGKGIMLVERIEGNPSTVIGLPVHLLIDILGKRGYWPPG